MQADGVQRGSRDVLRGPAFKQRRGKRHLEIFEHGEIVEDGRVLKGDRYPERRGGLRRHRRDPATAEFDLAQVRLQRAGNDVHQGRLAGAVLAENRVNLALVELDADVFKRADAGVDISRYSTAEWLRARGADAPVARFLADTGSSITTRFRIAQTILSFAQAMGAPERSLAPGTQIEFTC